MKQAVRIIGAFVVLFIVSVQPAHAVVFSDLVDFGGPGLGPGTAGSIEVADNVAPPAWIHDVTDDLDGQSLASVQIVSSSLAVSYRATSGDESWALAGDGVAIGTLAPTSTTILTTTFPLSPQALLALQTDGRLDIIPTESTSSTDSFRLYEATLSGQYEPLADPAIPEPSTLLLLAPGLLGIAAYRRDRRGGCA